MKFLCYSIPPSQRNLRAREPAGPNAIDVRFAIRDGGSGEPLLSDGISVTRRPDTGPMIVRRPACRPKACPTHSCRRRTR